MVCLAIERRGGRMEGADERHPLFLLCLILILLSPSSRPRLRLRKRWLISSELSRRHISDDLSTFTFTLKIYFRRICPTSWARSRGLVCID